MIWDILASGLVIWGGVMAVIGSLGLLRLPQPMQRLHAPSLSTGLAAVMLAVGSWQGGGDRGVFTVDRADQRAVSGAGAGGDAACKNSTIRSK